MKNLLVVVLLVLGATAFAQPGVKDRRGDLKASPKNQHNAMMKDLNLSEEQKAKLKDLNKDFQQKDSVTKADFGKQRGKMLAERQGALKSVLNKEQLEKFEKMEKARAEQKGQGVKNQQNAGVRGQMAFRNKNSRPEMGMRAGVNRSMYRGNRGAQGMGMGQGGHNQMRMQGRANFNGARPGMGMQAGVNRSMYRGNRGAQGMRMAQGGHNQMRMQGRANFNGARPGMGMRAGVNRSMYRGNRGAQGMGMAQGGHNQMRMQARANFNGGRQGMNFAGRGFERRGQNGNFNGGRNFRHKPNVSPEKIAKMQTERMIKALDLSEKQALKIERINLKYADRRMGKGEHSKSLNDNLKHKQKAIKSVLKKDQKEKYEKLLTVAQRGRRF